MKLRETLKINKNGSLEIGGCDTLDLVEQYGTPLYVMDEAYLRSNCQKYKTVLDNEYGDGLVCFASKAFCSVAVYQIVKQEGLGIDIVSGGELYTALLAGFDPQKIYFHGNNKLQKEIDYAVSENIHCIVVDSPDEPELIQAACEKYGKRQAVMVRLNPGISAHTHSFLQTAKIDSKFGFSTLNGDAFEFIKKLLTFDRLDLCGLHCHIGSQIFDAEAFKAAVNAVCDFALLLKNKLGISLAQLNFGGGYGIHYTHKDKPIEPQFFVGEIAAALKLAVKQRGLKMPRLVLEPGRSIVGEAGITLYRVGAVKQISGAKKFVSVDGGMADNPRYSLYKAQYSAALAQKMNQKPTETVTIAGNCCESDILIPKIKLPKACRGDILAVFSTGAYNYSMASNYNKHAVPPVVLAKEGKSYYIVKPQTYADMAARDVKLEQ